MLKETVRRSLMIKRVPVKWGAQSGAEKMRRLGWNTAAISLASLKFVDDAQNYIRNCPDANTVALLQDTIKNVKSGRHIVKEFIKIEDWLKNHDFPPF